MAFPEADTPIPPNDNPIPPNDNPIPPNDNRIPLNSNVIPHYCKEFAVISRSKARKTRNAQTKFIPKTPKTIVRNFYIPLIFLRFQQPDIIMGRGNSPVSPEDT